MFAPPLFSTHVGLEPFSKVLRRETFHGLYGEAPVSNFDQYFLPFTPFAQIPGEVAVSKVRGGGRGICCVFGGLLDPHESLKSTFNRRRLSSSFPTPPPRPLVQRGSTTTWPPAVATMKHPAQTHDPSRSHLFEKY